MMKEYQKYESKIPTEFKSDGCTLFPDGKKYKSCCRLHDYARKDKSVNNKKADAMFFECMKDRSNLLVAALTYLFVRIQGVTGLRPGGLMMLTLFMVILIAMFSL